MENEEKVMTGEESLRIITEMIRKTKMDIRDSSFHLIFWGWLILACSSSEYMLWKFTSFATPWYVWFFVIPGIIVSFTRGFIAGRKNKAFTYATKIHVWTWVGFFFSSFCLFIIHFNSMESVGAYMLTLAAIPLFISGIIINFRPLIIGAIAFWLLAVAARYGGSEISVLAIPVAMLAGYIIPGYLLRKNNSHDTVQGA